MEATLKRPRKLKSLEACNWTIVIDGVLIDAYLNQEKLGNKNGSDGVQRQICELLKMKFGTSELRQNPKLLNGKTSQYYFMINWPNFLEKIEQQKSIKIQLLKMRAKKVANVQKRYGTTIEEIDHLVETNEVILEGFDDDEHHSNNSPTRPSVTNSQDASSSMTKKRIKKVIEYDTSMI
ncbi:hypothetical protein KIW84_064301 [Lathyrus oleraceus]|uniref:Uncharacterized protein n=1 Tax=Pisum sativum TaxID=3888 RepID=A0A9D5A801_PEA|nr:hypothetical protein KIW84_064301 [Pisum sativum]